MVTQPKHLDIKAQIWFYKEPLTFMPLTVKEIFFFFLGNKGNIVATTKMVTI